MGRIIDQVECRHDIIYVGPPCKESDGGRPVVWQTHHNVIASLLPPAEKQLRTLLLIYKAFRLLASVI